MSFLTRLALFLYLFTSVCQAEDRDGDPPRLFVDPRAPHILVPSEAEYGAAAVYDLVEYDLTRIMSWLSMANIDPNTSIILSHGSGGEIMAGEAATIYPNTAQASHILSDFQGQIRKNNLWLGCDLTVHSGRASRNWPMFMSREYPGTVHFGITGSAIPVPILRGATGAELSLEAWRSSPERIWGIAVMPGCQPNSTAINTYIDGKKYASLPLASGDLHEGVNLLERGHFLKSILIFSPENADPIWRLEKIYYRGTPEIFSIGYSEGARLEGPLDSITPLDRQQSSIDITDAQRWDLERVHIPRASGHVMRGVATVGLGLGIDFVLGNFIQDLRERLRQPSSVTGCLNLIELSTGFMKRIQRGLHAISR